MHGFKSKVSNSTASMTDRRRQAYSSKAGIAPTAYSAIFAVFGLTGQQLQREFQTAATGS